MIAVLLSVRGEELAAVQILVTVIFKAAAMKIVDTGFGGHPDHAAFVAAVLGSVKAFLDLDLLNGFERRADIHLGITEAPLLYGHAAAVNGNENVPASGDCETGCVVRNGVFSFVVDARRKRQQPPQPSIPHWKRLNGLLLNA